MGWGWWGGDGGMGMVDCVWWTVYGGLCMVNCVWWDGYAPVFELARVLAEGLFALLADEDHLEGLQQGVVFFFLVAFGAVEPLLAAGRADGDLGVEDVFAHGVCVCGSVYW